MIRKEFLGLGFATNVPDMGLSPLTNLEKAKGELREFCRIRLGGIAFIARHPSPGLENIRRDILPSTRSNRACSR